MKRRRETPKPRWTIDAYETDGGEAPALSFIRQLEGRDKIEAIALVKLLEEQGSQLRRPQSAAVGNGLFELRGKQVPPGDSREDEGSSSRSGRSRRGSKDSGGEAVKKTGVMKWIDDELKADSRLARDVEDRIAEMKLEQQIVGLREKRGLTQRQLAKLLGTSQPYVAKLESGRVKNLGVKTLVKCAQALGASVSIRIAPLGRTSPTSGSRLRRAG